MHGRRGTIISILTTIIAAAFVGYLAGATEPAASKTAAFTTDADGFITNWLVLEPIRLDNLQHTEPVVRAIVEREDLKELLTALPKAGDKITLRNENCQWRSVAAKDYLVDLTAFATENQKPNVSVIFYGVAYVNAPEEMKDARLAIGSDDDSIWWLNGRQVIAAFGVRQTSTDDNVSKRLNLRKGVNILRFSVVQGDGPSGCCARFYDDKQEPITNLSVSLDPPASR